MQRGAARKQRCDQHRVILDHPHGAPHLDALAGAKIHQEDEGFVIFGEIPCRDILPITAQISKAQGTFIDDGQKPRGTTAMLNIGLTIGAGAGQEKAVTSGNEGS